jgi:hypothetical protein
VTAGTPLARGISRSTAKRTVYPLRLRERVASVQRRPARSGRPDGRRAIARRVRCSASKVPLSRKGKGQIRARAKRRGDRRRSRHAGRSFPRSAVPGLSFSHIQRVIRKGEVRVNGKRTTAEEPAGSRAGACAFRRSGSTRRSRGRRRRRGRQKTREFLKSITLYEDDDVLVLNKPMGLAVQGGSGTTRHLDGMLDVMRDAERPAAAAGASPRQGHRRLPAGGQDAVCRDSARQGVPLTRGAQDLLGAGCRRAQAAAGPHLDLSRQGGARGRIGDAHRQAWRGRARATR